VVCGGGGGVPVVRNGEGKLEGAVTTLASLVKDGILSIEDAAKRANMSVEVFKKYIY